MPVNGTQGVLDGIVKFGGGFLKTVDKTFEIVGNTVEHRVRFNTKLADHSLKDLRRLDHPYARRHGPDGIRIHEPNWQVHRQTGQLQDSIFTRQDKAAAAGRRVAAAVHVGFSEERAPHAAFVVYGTTRMIPRDPLEGSLNEVRPTIDALIRTDLKNAVVSFKSGGTSGSERRG